MKTSGLRIGKGFDLHRLEPGLPFLLGGVRIEHSSGFKAHSDGDILIHALIDSLLGAVGAGDIGTRFPDTDPDYKGISGKSLLKKTLALMPPVHIINVDMTVFAEEPPLTPFRAEIENSLANMLGIPPERVNLKAKTMEHLGLVGEGLAAAADIITLLELKAR